jgi:hypothetical protein
MIDSQPDGSRLDAVMPYAPAFIAALLLSSAVFVFSAVIDAPRVWPGTILCFVLVFSQFSYLTWTRRRGRR